MLEDVLDNIECVRYPHYTRWSIPPAITSVFPQNSIQSNQRKGASEKAFLHYAIIFTSGWEPIPVHTNLKRPIALSHAVLVHEKLR